MVRTRTSGAGSCYYENMQQLAVTILNVLESYIIPALFALSFITFIWATAKYYTQGKYNEEELEKAKVLIAYSLVILIIMMTVYLMVPWLIGLLLVPTSGLAG